MKSCVFIDSHRTWQKSGLDKPALFPQKETCQGRTVQREAGPVHERGERGEWGGVSGASGGSGALAGRRLCRQQSGLRRPSRAPFLCSPPKKGQQGPSARGRVYKPGTAASLGLTQILRSRVFQRALFHYLLLPSCSVFIISGAGGVKSRLTRGLPADSERPLLGRSASEASSLNSPAAPTPYSRPRSQWSSCNSWLKSRFTPNIPESNGSTVPRRQRRVTTQVEVKPMKTHIMG